MYSPLWLPRPWFLDLDAQILRGPDRLYVRLRNLESILRHSLSVRVVDKDVRVGGPDFHACECVAPGTSFGWVWPLDFCPEGKDSIDLEIMASGHARIHVSVPVSWGEGRIAVLPHTCLLVDLCADLTIRYTAGRGGISIGGGFRISMYCNKEGWINTLQTSDPGAPGCLAATCSVSSVTPCLLVDQNKHGPKGFKVLITNGPLEEGESVDVHLTQMGGHDARLFSAPGRHSWHSPVLWLLEDPLGRGDGHYVISRSDHPQLTLLPDQAERLRVTVPSIVTPREPFAVHVAAFDRFHNLATGLEGTVSIHLGDATTDVQLTNGFARADNFHVDSPGVYRIHARHANSGLAGLSNPTKCLPNERSIERLYWGDIHVHTMISDSAGTPSWSYAIGRDVMSLDFAAVIDHDMSFARDTGIAGYGDGDCLRTRGTMTLAHWHDLKPLMQFWGEDSWQYTCQVADEFNETGRFVTLKGYEWGQGRMQSDGTQPGHRNVYYRDTGPFLSSQDDEYGTPQRLWAHLEPGEAMTIPHSPAYTLTATGTDWRHHDERFDRAVEIFSSHGASEFFGNPDSLRVGQTDAEAGYVRKALGLGYHLGVLASTDGHAGIPAWTDPGRTLGKGAMVAVWATELTRSCVFDAIWQRRCYAVEGGARIILRFSVNGQAMGSEITAAGDVHIHADVMAEDQIAEVAVIRDGTEVFLLSGQADVAQLDYTERARDLAEHYYYVRVTQADGRRAWSSPAWVRSDRCASSLLMVRLAEEMENDC